jgi:hypothetical protein
MTQTGMSASSGKASDSLTIVSPQDEAFRAARRMFVAGDRVEISDLAGTLGVNRVTVHRWLGNRTQILTDVIWSLAEPTIEAATAMHQKSADPGSQTRWSTSFDGRIGIRECAASWSASTRQRYGY